MQFACYSGCAPFAHQSGASIRGKSKVHFIANRKMKMLLHMAALNAITFNDELKGNWQHNVAEGKNPMNILNSVRFKLICCIFLVIKRNEEFQKNIKNSSLKIRTSHRIQKNALLCIVNYYRKFRPVFHFKALHSVAFNHVFHFPDSVPLRRD